MYSSRGEDPWNRIFSLLFTRTLTVTKTDEYPDAGPFHPPDFFAATFLQRNVSTRTFEMHEDGDRAIEAFYPAFITQKGIDDILDEAHRRALADALQAALQDSVARPALDRALMQADLWSAFDALDHFASGRDRKERRDAAAAMTRLIARLIGRVALSGEQIAALPRNLEQADTSTGLPDVFSPPWTEIVTAPRREHDMAADMRRAARVFVRPAIAALDNRASLTGAALLMQTLLVDTRGRIVPTRVFSDVQLRTFTGGSVDVDEYELSRADLRHHPESGGFRHFAKTSPAFFAIAGNDYGFATPERDRRGELPPLVSTLSTRCAACHGSTGRQFMSLDLVHAPGQAPYPLVRLRQPNDDRAQVVIDEKASRDDFKHLIALAGFRSSVQ